MVDPQQQQITQSQRRIRPAILVGLAVLAAVASFAAVAFGSGTVTVTSIFSPFRSGTIFSDSMYTFGTDSSHTVCQMPVLAV